MRWRRFVSGSVASWALFVGALGVLYGHFLFDHIKNATNRFWFHDDARNTIPAFYRDVDPRLGAGDYLGDYELAHMPLLYRILFRVFAPLWDAEVLSRILPYVALLATVVFVALAAHRLAGKAAAFGAAALVLGSSIYLERITGMTPRGFAYPILAAEIAALAYGKMRPATACVIVGAGLYPMTAVVNGLALAAVLLALPPSDRGEATGWDLRRRLRVLAIAGFATVLLNLPALFASRAYGPKITSSDYAAYPEAGSGGIIEPQDLPPYRSFVETASDSLKASVFGAGNEWWPQIHFRQETVIASEVLLALALLGIVLLVRQKDVARRIFAFAAATFGAHAIALFLAPYLYAPTRYPQYTLPLLAAIALPASAVALAEIPRRISELNRRALGWAGVIVLLDLVGGLGDATAGYTVRVDDRLQKLYAKIAELPPDSLIAGWPDEMMSNLPYVARRRALMTGEMMVPFPSVNLGYLDEMRKRMQAFLDAYYATSPEPIVLLHERYGVTHMILDLPQFEGAPPGYVQPMGDWVKAAVQRASGKHYELIRQIDNAAIHKDDRFVVIDLARLKRDPVLPQLGDKSAEIHLGQPVVISSAGTGACITAPAQPPGPVHLEPCRPKAEDQSFLFQRIEGTLDVSLQKRDAKGSLTCLQVQESSTQPNALVELAPCAPGAPAQALSPQSSPSGHVGFKFGHSKLALDARPDNRTLQQFVPHNGANQRWHLSYPSCLLDRSKCEEADACCSKICKQTCLAE